MSELLDAGASLAAGSDDDFVSSNSFPRQRASPIKPFAASRIGRDHPSSPTLRNALHDGIQAQTTLQSAMIRERAYMTSKWAGPAKADISTVGASGMPQPAGKKSGNTIWGTVRVPEDSDVNGHAPKGPPSLLSPLMVVLSCAYITYRDDLCVHHTPHSTHAFLSPPILPPISLILSHSRTVPGMRAEHRADFAACATRPEPLAAKYALGMQSSVSFSFVDADGEPSSSSSSSAGGAAVALVPQAYAKHLGVEPQVAFNSGPVALVSDRAPEAVVERRRRRNLHKLLVGSSAVETQPFNRRCPEGSLSQYAEARVLMAKLTGACHVDGDLDDVGQPRVKLWLDPRDNAAVHPAKSDPRFGSRSEVLDVGAYDCDFSLTRPRTTGYSPGHVRSLVFGPLGSPARGTTAAQHCAASARTSALSSSRPASLEQPQAQAPPWSPVQGLGTSSLGAMSGASSTARRVAYCNDLHEALAAKQGLAATARRERVEKGAYEVLSAEVKNGIDAFEASMADRKAKGWKGV